MSIQKNAANTISFDMQDTSGVYQTGKTVAGTVSIDGAAFGAVAGTITEIASGAYKFAGTSADWNGNAITLRFTATGCRDTFVHLNTEADYSTTKAGYLDAAISSRSTFVAGQNVGTATSVTGAVGSVTGNVGGNVTGSVGSVAGVTFPATVPSASAIATAVMTDTTDLIGGDIVAIKAKTDNLPADPASNTQVNTRMATFSLPSNFSGLQIDGSGNVTVGTIVAAAIQSIYDRATSAMTTVGSIGKRLNDFVTTLVYSAPPAAAPTASQVAAAILVTPANLLATDGSGRVTVSDKTGYSLTTAPPTAAAIATAVMSDVSDTVGADVVAIKAKTDNLPAAPAAVSNIPTAANILAAFKADTDWQTMLGNVNGVFAYNPTTGVLTLHDKANSVLLATLTLTKDGSGNITSRASA